MVPFKLSLRRYCVENARFLLLMGAVMFGFFVLTGIFAGMLFPHDLRGTAEVYMVLSIILIILFMSYAGSVVFREMSSRQGRISTLMTPVSPIRQLTVRGLVYVVALPVMLVLFALCSDCLRLLTHRLLYPEATIEWADQSFMSIHLECIDWYNLICGLFATQSFYILGSILWPKFSFIKTYAIMAALQLLLGVFILPIVINDPYFFRIFGYRNFVENNIESIVAVLLTVTVIVNWSLTLLRFREADVIERPL